MLLNITINLYKLYIFNQAKLSKYNHNHDKHYLVQVNQ